MGDWGHPDHYTSGAKDFARATRAAEIDIMVRRVLPQLRATAREVGYALAVHGSLERDFDIVAVPWTETAGSPTELVEGLCKTCRAATGWGYWHNAQKFTAKPHGRLAVTIVASAEVQIDLSIMPRTPHSA